MGFLDKLFGTNQDEEYRRTTQQVRQASAARNEDEIAVERYRYLLRTASPEAIEQVHEEAFSKLTPEQRHMLYTQLSADAPAGEAPLSEEPRALAVSATRSEMRQPGTMERTLGQAGAAPGFGSMFASSLLGSVAGYVIASSLMTAFMPMDMGADTAGADTGGDPGSDFGANETISADGGFGDPGMGDAGFGDAGFGDFGDFGF
ncbi:hypothetical protein [Aurantimicrobium sp. MWH-Uga1]|uniref:hypothetical protein n=1 Tax=Aurantimicrobium sp. MWH-Uga1 TaxID=2079575 RepID=UPI000DED5581|nr:hypothetical protein [Aurantimicrobium sp. MWH-Uga1]AXE53815.1 hypothetical protein AURUGA1_00099 [Aurantimicrobium sp. MWH-Uga1]